MVAVSPRSSLRSDDGFSLIEMLVALVVTMLIVGTALWLLATDTVLAQAVPHAADLQQRGRLALTLLARDLSAAGAGPAYGRLSGALGRALPPVVPRRVGLTGSDPFNAARADAITILWSPAPGQATETTTAVAGDAPAMTVADAPNCGGVTLCGLTAGTNIAIFDESGRHGLYVVTAVSGAVATLRSLQPAPPSFAPGAVVLPVESHSYVFDTAARQLRSYDGYLSDAVVVDDVVGVEVMYLGEGRPPVRPKPVAGTANCLFDAAGNAVAALSTLAPAGDSLAPLPLDLFTDGPWCGEGDRRFDVDLMRVRAVRVRIRLQSALDQFRATGPDFRRPGSNINPLGGVPDLTVATEVTPWNLNAGR
ncbi:MAG: prepilin-type N-terminal cleavage/methylation domain-containing protein [Acidobacteriota bacterium]